MIFLIRHGQTEYNVERRYQGARDSPLTEMGRTQARAMGEALRALVAPGDVQLFASPRGRAQETMRIIAQAAGIAREPIVEPGIAEISLGSWDGLTGPEIDALTDGAWSRMDPHGWFFETPDGERYESVADRLAAALARVRAHEAPVRIMISHGVAGRVLRGLHLGLPRAQALALPVPQGIIYRLDEGAIAEIDCRG
jgi:probable phosphoglycerate mutase